LRIYIYIYKNNPRKGDTVVPRVENVQDTEVIKQDDDVCLVGQRWDYACRLSEKECNYHGKVLCCNSCQTEAAPDLQFLRDKLSKGILFLQDNAALHKAAIIYQKLADLHFEVLKHLASSTDLATFRTTTSFVASRNTSREGSFQALSRPH
jgi:hypothetical protein